MEKRQSRGQKAEKEQRLTGQQISATDPQGSYTGVPVNPEEKPVQDADDL